LQLNEGAEGFGERPVRDRRITETKIDHVQRLETNRSRFSAHGLTQVVRRAGVGPATLGVTTRAHLGHVCNDSGTDEAPL